VPFQARGGAWVRVGLHTPIPAGEQFTGRVKDRDTAPAVSTARADLAWAVMDQLGRLALGFRHRFAVPLPRGRLINPLY
jgi:hypothetical protein